jgi:hypothetical protein
MKKVFWSFPKNYDSFKDWDDLSENVKTQVKFFATPKKFNNFIEKEM